MRDNHQFAEHAETLKTSGAVAVHFHRFEAGEYSIHDNLVTQLVTRYGPIGIAIVAFGILGNQQQAEQDSAHARHIVETNFLAHVSILTPLAQQLRAQRSGSLVMFSSVAGIRVRQANYVYGSTKAALDGFASGLADSLYGTGVHTLLVRPGFVVGNMTQDLTDSGVSPAPFSRTAPEVAEAVAKALSRGKRVVWVPRVLRPIFGIMRVLPQLVWRKLPR